MKPEMSPRSQEPATGPYLDAKYPPTSEARCNIL